MGREVNVVYFIGTASQTIQGRIFKAVGSNDGFCFQTIDGPGLTDDQTGILGIVSDKQDIKFDLEARLVKPAL